MAIHMSWDIMRRTINGRSNRSDPRGAPDTSILISIRRQTFTDANPLDGQDFLLFLFRDFFQLVDVIVGQLLGFGERVFFVVFGNEFVFEHLF
jgi:hypothetical protein